MTNPTRTNARDQHCARCGTLVRAGKGRLERHWDDEEDEFRGWDVFCVDKDACKARVEAAREAHRAAEERARAHRLAVAALFDLARAEGAFPRDPGLRPEGETVFLDGSRNRIYGGGRWAVIESAGERRAPAPEELEAARAEVELAEAPRKAAQAALDGATAPLRAWASAHGSFGVLNEVGVRRYARPETLDEGLRLAATWKALDEALRATPGPTREQHVRLDGLEQQALLATYPRAIWLVQGNGGDGDDWGHNNVQSGIAWRLPWTEELEAKVRAARELPTEEET